MESLIMQRMRIDRARALGRWMLVVGVLWFVLSAFMIGVDPARLSGWAFAGVSVGWVVLGTRHLSKHRAQTSIFEREHGPDAGKQEPVQVLRRRRDLTPISTRTGSD